MEFSAGPLGPNDEDRSESDLKKPRQVESVSPEPKDKLNRREFLAPAVATAAFTLVPRHVLGGPGYVPPSDKLTLAYIGCGTQGIREAVPLLSDPNLQIVSVCDPEKDNTNYVDWSPTGLRDGVREVLQDPSWGGNYKGIRAGRDCLKGIVEQYYAKQRSAEHFHALSSYEDFRELLEKERDLDAVKVMTPDHLHATIAIAAMKKKKHVAVHKGIANRLTELRLALDTQREMGVRTHLLAHQPPTFASALQVRQMILDGAIGTLREIHNWTDRPLWPQFASRPTDRPPVPKTFNWKLWLGPVPDRPYHPNYTHALFRGWYDFGAGSLTDMGTYSMWPIYSAFDLPVPTSVQADVTHDCAVDEHGVSRVQPNDDAFPLGTKVRFTFAAHGNWGPLVLYWYDGGIRPNIPEELAAEGHGMPAVGRMFVGDKGIILDNDLVPASKNAAYRKAKGIPEPAPQPVAAGSREPAPWVGAFRNNTESAGDFQKAAAVSEGTCLATAAMRVSRGIFTGGSSRMQLAADRLARPEGAPLLWDAQNMKFTNSEEANQYLSREYRDGWKLG